MRVVLVAGLVLIASASGTSSSKAQSADGSHTGWTSYGGDAGGSRYSSLTQIDKNNVSQLTIAWEIHTGDVSDGSGGRPKSEFEATPIVAGGTMFVTTPFNRVLALDPETGKEKWNFDPKIDLQVHYSEGLVNRGVSYWPGSGEAQTGPCQQRIFLATIDARLFALDALTGNPCSDFGTAGQIDLTQGISNITRPGEYEETSAPAIVDDLVIVGSSIADNDRVDIPNGGVRAFDARTGLLRWRWDPLQGNLAPTGAGNVWSTISVDAQRGLVFLPTGSASPDYHGLKRPGDNKWANSVVALSAKTGELVWGFQLVHHDLWDYDTAAQPVLGTLRRDGAETPVVIQGNKTGNLFVLNRETGEPVFGVRGTRRPKERRGRRKRVADPAVPARASAAGVAAACRRRRLGHQSRRARRLPHADGKAAIGRHFHAAQRAGHHRLSRQSRRHELEQRRLRSGTADLRHQRQQPSDGSSSDPARSVPAGRESRPAGRVARGGVSAARNALWHEPSGASFAARIALQPAAMGRIGRGRFVQRIHSCGRCRWAPRRI